MIRGRIDIGKVVFIGGPTAVGKSEVALVLAERMGGEIVSVDSMQVYRGMDIGTAKPTHEDRMRVRHHLIDVVDVTETFNVARFLQLADEAVLDIQSRNKIAILCGGTGLYFRAFLEGVGTAPPPDPKLREELERMPLETLLEELAARDPETYARIDKRNRRRVVRAIEAIRLSGKPFSELRSPWNTDSMEVVAGRFFILTRDPSDLRKRICDRVEKMFKCGLVEETKRLLELGLGKNPTACQAIGYRQVLEYLQGKRSLPETIELVKRRTWLFARRQLAWFKYQIKGQWILVAPTQSGEEVAEIIFRNLIESGPAQLRSL